MRVRVPTFFRVRHTPDAPPVASSSASQSAPIPKPTATTRLIAPPPPPANTTVETPSTPPATTTTTSNPLDNTLLSDSGFGGGSGTQADPYRITSADQLQRIANSLSGHFVLLNDIDVSCSAGWDGGKGFRPIGNNAMPFSGVFNGNGHRITGLRIARFGIVTSDIALFGATSARANFFAFDQPLTCFSLLAAAGRSGCSSM
jgi:hypothetical protein